MKKSLILALLFLLLGCLVRFLLIGYNTTACLLWGIAVLIALYALLKKKGWKRARNVLTVLLCVGLAGLIALEIPIIRSAHTDEDAQADYLIVLGAGVHGSTPSLSLTERLRAAKDYMERYPDAVAVVSGGQGPGEDITEAEAMRRWLEANGIAPERILMEDRAESTVQNIAYSMDILRTRGDGDAAVAIVSSEYHLFRAKWLARQQGVESPIGIAGHTGYPLLRCNYFLREAVCVVWQWVFG